MGKLKIYLHLLKLTKFKFRYRTFKLSELRWPKNAREPTTRGTSTPITVAQEATTPTRIKTEAAITMLAGTKAPFTGTLIKDTSTMKATLDLEHISLADREPDPPRRRPEPTARVTPTRLTAKAIIPTRTKTVVNTTMPAKVAAPFTRIQTLEPPGARTHRATAPTIPMEMVAEVDKMKAWHSIWHRRLTRFHAMPRADSVFPF